MTLQSSPPISAGDINVELGRSRSATFHINGSEERALAGKPSGTISFSDFLGKSRFSISYAGTAETVGTAGVVSNVPIGTADSGRRVFAIVHVVGINGSGPTLNAATIGGASATIHVQKAEASSTAVLVAIISANVASGTTATINLNLSGIAPSIASAGAFSVIGYSSSSDTDSGGFNTQTSYNDLSGSLSVDAGGTVILGTTISGAGSIVWSGGTERYEETVAGGGTAKFSGAMTTGISAGSRSVGMASSTLPNPGGGSWVALAIK